MEYSFISHQTFDNLIRQYIGIKEERKSFDWSRKITKNKGSPSWPKNTMLYTSICHYCAANKFKLQKI